MAMWARERGSGKMLPASLLVFNLLSSIILLGLAAWWMDHVINAIEDNGDYSDNGLSGFEGNAATSYLVTFALIAGVVAVGSYFVGLHHLRVWTTPSASAAQAAAWVTFGLLMLPFALACKQIHLGSVGDKVTALAAFAIILTVVHFVYTLVLYSAVK